MLYYFITVVKAAYYFQKITPPVQDNDSPFVSVIIPARNEARNIEKCLLSVLNQSYPTDKWEVILIDDHSEDDTLYICTQISAQYPQLKVLSLTQDKLNSHKKAALTQAISHAKGEVILQTDADCFVNPNWIATMMAYFDADTAMVSGPVQLSYDNSAFQQIQALEFIGLNVLGAGSIAQGKPNMCNGANLAYRKHIYKEVNGFEGIDTVASGDDELLMQKIVKKQKYKIHYAADFCAIVQTPAQADFSSFWRQRVRWVSKSRNYLDRSINLVQMIFFLAIAGIGLYTILGFIEKSFLWVAGLSLCIKIIADVYHMFIATQFFRQQNLRVWLVFLEVSYIPYVTIMGIVGNLTQKYEWKGRSVK